MTKVELLETIYNKLVDVQNMMDEEAFSDEDIDDVYSSIDSVLETVSDILVKAEGTN